MAVMAGFNGNVLWMSDAAVASDSTKIYLSDATHRLYSWSLDYTTDTVDTTDFTSTGWKAFTPTLKTWNATVEAFIDSTKPIPISDVGSTAVLRLFSYISDETNDDSYYRGDAICTGIHPSVSVEGIETQTIDFQGTDALIQSDVTVI